MPRPPKPRWVEREPRVRWFIPAPGAGAPPEGPPGAQTGAVELAVEELEALRLKDLEGLDQEECARRMNLAQSSYQRLLAGARQKVALALVEGKALQIGGGHYVVVAPRFQCRGCGHRWGWDPGPETPIPHAPGPGRGRRRGHGAGEPAHGRSGRSGRGGCPACGREEVVEVTGAQPDAPPDSPSAGAGPGFRRGRGGPGCNGGEGRGRRRRT